MSIRTSAAGTCSRDRPATSTITRSATPNAACTFCSTSTTVTPVARTRVTAAITSCTSRGDSPAEGSSSSSTAGFASIAQANASICRCPPDKSPASVPNRPPSSGNNAKTSAVRPVSRRPSRNSLETCRFSRIVIEPNTLRSCGTYANPAAARRAAGTVVTSLPAITIRPARARSSPASVRTKLDFPEPFGPITARMLPASTTRSIPRTMSSPSPYPARSPVTSSATLTPRSPRYASNTRRSPVTSAKLPDTSGRPSASTCTWSHNDPTRPMSCSTSTNAIPSSRNSRTTAMMVPSSGGETPAAGSSSMTIRGRSISARANSSSFRCPPDKRPAGTSHSPHNPTRCNTPRATPAWARSASRMPPRRNSAPPGLSPRCPGTASNRFSSTVKLANARTIWNVRTSPAPTIRCAAHPPRSCPSNTIRPASGRDQPTHDVDQRRLSRTVRPDQPRHRPSREFQRAPVDRTDPAERFRHPVDLEQRCHSNTVA